MAYQIDFSESIWASRRRRKALLRVFLAAAAAGAVWGVRHVYKVYNQPTLNMKLSKYESAARPVEEINAAWDETAKEFDSILRYYRLVWSSSPTNFLNAMSSADAPHFGKGFHPLRWKLTTGGECRLDYMYEFAPGDKARQAMGIEETVVNAVTSVVDAAEGKVTVSGVQLENLLRVEALDVSIAFALPAARNFPAKEGLLADCVREIGAMRAKVMGTKIADGDAARGGPSDVRGMMMAYLPVGKEKPGFPDMANAISVSGWLERADRFILANGMPGDGGERKKLKESWNKIGDARYPWDRFRALDNEELVARTEAIGTVSDAVKRFKGFLDKRRADCARKLEPFIDAYDRNDVFNKPLVESDLKDRVASASGIARALVSFKEEPGAEPSVLAKPDEKFTFSWVRWSLAINGERGTSADAPAQDEPITLGMLADCVRRTLELGPGYALDSVEINFGVDGNVMSAVLNGLLPVKKVESTKEAVKNVD